MKLRYLFAALCLCLLLASPAAAAGGSGTAADPYIITTAAELQSMQNNLAAHYQLANDIDLSGVTWTPIGSQSALFSGSFDGNGKTIKNLNLIATTAMSGFFGTITSGAVIKNVIFQDCLVTSSSYENCGVAIGGIYMSETVHETAIISNVDCVRCSLDISGNSFGGVLVGKIVTYSVVEITDCNVSYSIASGGRYIGCLIGDISSDSNVEITGCNVLYSKAYASVYNVGGILGIVQTFSSVVIDSSTVQNSIIECNDSGAGGLVGQNDSRTQPSLTALNCDVGNCIIKAGVRAGGLFGVGWGGSYVAQECAVSDCTIVASNNYAGGIAAHIPSGTTGIFSDCSVTDTTIIASNTAAGGICPAYS